MTKYQFNLLNRALSDLTEVKRVLINVDQECELGLYDSTILEDAMVKASLTILYAVSDSLSEKIYDNRHLRPDIK